MKQLHISCLPNTDKSSPINEITLKLDSLDRHAIDFVLWTQNKDRPKVQFSITHGFDCIFLKYYVKENNIRAVYSNPNDPVHQDSCVEFFIAFNNDTEYYNLEFNCLGTCSLGFGRERMGRTSLPDSTIRKIKFQTLISTGTEPENHIICWELTLTIPLEVFQFHNLKTLEGESCSVNFYKCGDNLPKPHYMAWNNIQSETPNFHLPAFFGKAKFL